MADRLFKWQREQFGIDEWPEVPAHWPSFENVRWVVDYSQHPDFAELAKTHELVAVHTMADIARQFPTINALLAAYPTLREGLVQGWKSLAHRLGLDASNLRRAYRSDEQVRRYIHRTGRRVWADAGELNNLLEYFKNRREGGTARRTFARKRTRATHGRFTGGA